jgi:hypothetical protein
MAKFKTKKTSGINGVLYNNNEVNSQEDKQFLKFMCLAM